MTVAKTVIKRAAVPKQEEVANPDMRPLAARLGFSFGNPVSKDIKTTRQSELREMGHAVSAADNDYESRLGKR